MLTNQGHELARTVLFELVPGFSLDYADEPLGLSLISDRDYQTAPGP